MCVFGWISLLLRKYYRIVWINNYTNSEFKVSNQFKYLNEEFNNIILNVDPNTGGKPFKFLKNKKFFTVGLLFESLIMLLCPLPFFEMYLPGG
jgi:hypothetical protein